jgi:hypothetical protein
MRRLRNVRQAAGRLSVLVGVMIAVTACAPTPALTRSPSGGPVIAAPVPGWDDLPDGPLSKRQQAYAFWTGREVLVLGGSDAPPCPPNADCAIPAVPPLQDGAAYDPATQTWRRLADAPLPVGSGSGAVVDGTVWIWLAGFEPAPGVRTALLAYDIAGDAWREVEVPDGVEIGSKLVAAGTRLLVHPATEEQGPVTDRLYDPATDTWSDLPADPIGPTFDRAFVWTGQSLVLLGVSVVLPAAGPPVYRAAVWDAASGEWQRLPDSDITVYDSSWWWVDGRVVNASVGWSDGGQVNGWGRRVPHGGILDPAGGWRPLPDGPEAPGRFVLASTAGPEHVVSSGWVLHVPTGRWTELGEPPGGSMDGPASVWAGDQLVVFGGVRWAGMQGDILDTGWVWRPG